MTPLYKALKTNGTSFYAFPGAAEDISAAYQNSNYKMYFSKYVLLNFPKQVVNSATNDPVYFDFQNDSLRGFGFQLPKSYTPPQTFGEQIIESLRNYIANHEVTMKESKLNSTEYYYDNTVISTPTERIFWKWARKLNLMSLEPANDGDEFFGNLIEFEAKSTAEDYFPEQLWRERETVDYSIFSIYKTNNALYTGKLEIRLELDESPYFQIGDVIELSGIEDPNLTNLNTQRMRIQLVTPKTATVGVTLITDFDFTSNTIYTLNGDGFSTIVYHRLVQYIGEVNGINNVQQANRSYTEVYAHVPDHTGKTPDILFRTGYDKNYKPQMTYPILPSQYQPEIVGAETFTNPLVSNPAAYPGGYYGYFDTDDFTYTTSDGDTNRKSGDYYGIGGTRTTPTRDSRNIDGLTLDFDPAHYVKMNIAGQPITNFDQFNAMMINGAPPADFEFNGILWYYTVEDSNGNKTNNLYGISFVDNPNNNPIPTEDGIRMPAYRKLASNSTQDGTSYAFSLNLNFNIINENVQDTYNPEAINSLFSFNLFNDAMRRLGDVNDSFLRILTSQNQIQTDVMNLKQLVYTQTDFQTINSRITNLENLLKIYSTNQIDSTESILVTRDDSQRPPRINMKNIDPNYDVVINLRTSAMYNINGAIPAFVTVPLNKNFLIYIQNDDINNFTLPNNEKLTVIFDRDLSFKQTVDIVVDANATATQNKQVEVFVNFTFGESANPIETQLIETIDLPVYYNTTTALLNTAATRDRFTLDVDIADPLRLNVGGILEMKLVGTASLVKNSVEKGDTLMFNDFIVGTSSSTNFSGQYRVNNVGPTNSMVFLDVSNNKTLIDFGSRNTLPYTFNDSAKYLISTVPYLKYNKGLKYRVTRISDNNFTQITDRYFVEKYELNS